MPERDAHRRDKNELLFQNELKKITQDMKEKHISKQKLRNKVTEFRKESETKGKKIISEMKT